MKPIERPYLPIAIGFYLLGAPLLGLALLGSGGRAAVWTNAVMGTVLVVLGALLHRRSA